MRQGNGVVTLHIVSGKKHFTYHPAENFAQNILVFKLWTSIILPIRCLICTTTNGSNCYLRIYERRIHRWRLHASNLRSHYWKTCQGNELATTNMNSWQHLQPQIAATLNLNTCLLYTFTVKLFITKYHVGQCE